MGNLFVHYHEHCHCSLFWAGLTDTSWCLQCSLVRHLCFNPLRKSSPTNPLLTSLLVQVAENHNDLSTELNWNRAILTLVWTLSDKNSFQDKPDSLLFFYKLKTWRQEVRWQQQQVCHIASETSSTLSATARLFCPEPLLPFFWELDRGDGGLLWHCRQELVKQNKNLKEKKHSVRSSLCLWTRVCLCFSVLFLHCFSLPSLLFF